MEKLLFWLKKGYNLSIIKSDEMGRVDGDHIDINQIMTMDSNLNFDALHS